MKNVISNLSSINVKNHEHKLHGFDVLGDLATVNSKGEAMGRKKRSQMYPLLWDGHREATFCTATYRPSYCHPGVATCSLGKPEPVPGSAATGTARSAVGGPFQTFLAEQRARATGFSL